MKKKRQQPCGSVKWKQPARTDVHASARLHVGKGFHKTVDELSKSSKMQWHVDGCS